MNEYEKLGLSLLIIAAPVWANNMDGLQGGIFLLVIFAGSFLFMVGHHFGSRDVHP